MDSLDTSRFGKLFLTLESPCRPRSPGVNATLHAGRRLYHRLMAFFENADLRWHARVHCVLKGHFPSPDEDVCTIARTLSVQTREHPRGVNSKMRVCVGQAKSHVACFQPFSPSK